MVALLRANRASGLPLIHGCVGYTRNDTTLLRWLQMADAVEASTPKPPPPGNPQKLAWPKAFWEL